MIKVTIGEKPQEEVKPFPKLMVVTSGGQYIGRVVLFKEERKGFVVKPSSADYMDTLHFSENWNMEFFTDYNEPITLQNA